MVTLIILDDPQQQDNKSIMISVTRTEGRSHALPSSDPVILVCDNAGGVIRFQIASRSPIDCKGRFLFLLTTFTFRAVNFPICAFFG